MAMTVRLNDREQEGLRKKCVEINKLLIQRGMQPIKDSELVHIILEQTIAYAELTPSGNIKIRTEFE